MKIPFKIVRERWSLEELMSDEMDEPRHGFALVIDEEHFPHFRYQQLNEIALALDRAASGGEGGTVKLRHAEIRIEKSPGGGVTIHTPANADRRFNVDDARGLARDLTSPLAQTLTPSP